MTNPSKYGLCKLLHADLLRQHDLLSGQVSSSPGNRIWLRVMSPRFVPVLLYRLSYKCQVMHLGFAARFFSLMNFLIFGIEIATNCQIGPGLFLPHTHGTVIGAFNIGRNATIYQGVTVGAKDLDFTYDELHRPVVGNNVLIGAGAKVLGGVRIGDNVRVAANAVVLKSIADNVTVAGVPAVVINKRGDE